MARTSKLTPNMVKSLANLAAHGGRVPAFLNPMREAGVDGRSIDALKRRGLVDAVEPLDPEQGAKDYEITDAGRATLAEITGETPVPTFDEFVSATSGAVRAALSPSTEVTEESANEDMPEITRVLYTYRIGNRGFMSPSTNYDNCKGIVAVHRDMGSWARLYAVVHVASDYATTGRNWEEITRVIWEVNAPTEITHVITFLDGSTERAIVVGDELDDASPSYGVTGHVWVRDADGTSRMVKFGPSGDAYQIEPVAEYDARTAPVTDQEISDALAILRDGPVESHETSIRDTVALELHIRKLAVMATAGSTTWWMLRLWEPSDSYDTPSAARFEITTTGTVVRVYDADEYTQDSRVQYDDGTDNYVSVFDLRPYVEQDERPASQATASNEEFVTESGEILTVLSVATDGTVRAAGWDGTFARVVSAWELTPERLWQYTEDQRAAARENMAEMREAEVSDLRTAAMGREASGEILADWERDLLASARGEALSVPERRLDARLAALVLDHVKVYKDADNISMWGGADTYGALLDRYKVWVTQPHMRDVLNSKLRRLGLADLDD